MPMIWTAPAVALTHRGAVVYHTYKNESADDRNEFWYNTDYAESEVYAFDVRDLPVPAGVDPSNHALIIAHAIDNGLVAFEDEIELDEIQVGAVVEGMANPGDSVAVDVAAWLLAASQEELYELAMGGWGESARTDHIAQWMQDKNYLVAEFLAGFTYGADAVRVVFDADKAMTFLKESRAEAYWALQCALGRAVKVTGRVDELLTISKEVEAYVELSEEQRNDYVEVGEDGALQLDHLNLTVDSMFAEKMNQAVRDAAYKRTIINSNHAWEPIETRDVQVNAEIA